MKHHDASLQQPEQQLQRGQPSLQYHQRQSFQFFSKVTSKQFVPSSLADVDYDHDHKSSSSSSSFAVVDHSLAYEEQAIRGRHGQQLALAELDAIGKDDDVYDPFAEFELDDDNVIELEHDDEEEGNYSSSKSKKSNSTSTLEEAEYNEIKPSPPRTTSSNNTDEDNMASILGTVDRDEDGYLEDENNNEDDDDDDEDEGDLMFFNNDGSVPYKKSQLARFQAGAPAGGMFCVLEFPGTQHKVTVDDLIVVNKLKPTHHFQVGSVHTFTDEKVLLVGSSHRTLVGMPFVPGAQVDIMVEEITMDKKVIAFKKRRKKNSQRKKGFRRQVSLLRVLDIRMPAPYHTMDPYVPREEPLKD